MTDAQFFWSPLGGPASWNTAEIEQPKGAIKYRIVVNEECVQSGKMVVLPENFSPLIFKKFFSHFGHLFISSNV